MEDGRLFIATNNYDRQVFFYNPVKDDYTSGEAPLRINEALVALDGNRVYAGINRKRLLRGAEYLGYEYMLYVYDGGTEQWKTYKAPKWTKKTWGRHGPRGRSFWSDDTRMLVCNRPGCLWIRPPEE